MTPGFCEAYSAPVCFDDGEGIHVEAQQECGSRLCAFQQTNDTGLADAFRHLDAKRFQLLRHNATGADFTETELGVHMKVTAQGLGIGEEFFGFIQKIDHG